MSDHCQTCGNLQVRELGKSSLNSLERSGFKNCDGCSILSRAVDTALSRWYPPYSSEPFLKDAIGVSWQTSSSRKLFIVDVNRVEPQGPSRPLLKLQLHTERGSVSRYDAIGAAGLVSGDSNTEKSVETIRKWLHVCTEEHQKCNSIKTEWSQRIPIPAKRVIDVGDETRPPRLLEERVVRGYYACLSHCWGQANLLTTTKDTLQQRRQEIPLELMPRTFQDAILLTRTLGLKYLWIDSLCICQDDVKEWKQEASRMYEIYGHAFLTIAATAAHDSTKGLFSIRDTSLAVPGTDLYVRKKLDHLVFRRPVLSAAQASLAAKYPLFTRGWCLQERLLSNRILHFTATELVWQCRSSDLCECDGIKLINSVTSSKLLTSRLKYNRVVEGNSGSDIWTIWREIVEDYCSTNLTKDSDYLPALSGVAAKFGLAGAGTFIAGLWHKPGALSLGSSPLFLDLLWKSSDKLARRPVVRVAPSFSWASRLGPISYHNEARDGPTMRYHNVARDGKRRYIDKCIFVMQLDHGYEGLDRYSEAPDAVIKTRAQLIACNATASGDGQQCSICIDGHGEHLFTADVYEGLGEQLDALVFIMPVAAYEHYKSAAKIFDGLVLARVRDTNYRRIGLIEGLPSELLISTGHQQIILA